MLISILLARRRLIAKLLAFISSLILSDATSSANPPVESARDAHDSAPDVNVIAKREGEETHLLVENKELCEVTMTFQMRLVNLTSSRTLPCTETFPPGKTTEAFSLEPTSPNAKWEYSYT